MYTLLPLSLCWGAHRRFSPSAAGRVRWPGAGRLWWAPAACRRSRCAHACLCAFWGSHACVWLQAHKAQPCEGSMARVHAHANGHVSMLFSASPDGAQRCFLSTRPAPAGFMLAAHLVIVSHVAGSMWTGPCFLAGLLGIKSLHCCSSGLASCRLGLTAGGGGLTPQAIEARLQHIVQQNKLQAFYPPQVLQQVVQRLQRIDFQ